MTTFAREITRISRMLDAIAAQRDFYESALGSMADDDFRQEIEMFGRKTTKGAFLVNTSAQTFTAPAAPPAVDRNRPGG